MPDNNLIPFDRNSYFNPDVKQANIFIQNKEYQQLLNILCKNTFAFTSVAPYSHSVLQVAVNNSDVALVKIFLKSGAQAFDYGFGPLIYYSFGQQNAEITRLLLEHANGYIWPHGKPGDLLSELIKGDASNDLFPVIYYEQHIKALLDAGFDPHKKYDYELFDVGEDNVEDYSYAEVLSNYELKKYKLSAIGFSELIEKDNLASLMRNYSRKSLFNAFWTDSEVDLLKTLLLCFLRLTKNGSSQLPWLIFEKITQYFLPKYDNPIYDRDSIPDANSEKLNDAINKDEIENARELIRQGYLAYVNGTPTYMKRTVTLSNEMKNMFFEEKQRQNNILIKEFKKHGLINNDKLVENGENSANEHINKHRYNSYCAIS